MDDVVEYVEELGEPVIVEEVAEALDCGTSTAREKLLLAVENGRLRTKSPGSGLGCFGRTGRVKFGTVVVVPLCGQRRPD